MYRFQRTSHREGDEYTHNGRRTTEELYLFLQSFHKSWEARLDLSDNIATNKRFKDILYEFVKHGGSYELTKME